eukprot:GHVP01027871.1.p1 GENE.GHVP01027871.1~~GHVP01027871.1.p1  ORF type:complete len:130 (-),score=15.56 GHVP01027871.1:19-408(-)
MKSLRKITPCAKDNARYFGPVVIVTKPNGAVRVTQEFSGLKMHTPLFNFNQESIEGIWKWASSKAYLIKLDFIKAFHSVPISSEDQRIVLSAPTKYTVLPMGCRNLPALFAEFMGKSLKDILSLHPDKI